MKLLFVIVLTFSFSANAWEYKPQFWPDSAYTNSAIIASNLLLVADWGQTRDIATNELFVERNRHLGERPTRKEVDRYFIERLIIHNVLGYLVPVKYKDIFYVTVTIYQAEAVVHNYKAGVIIKF